MINRILVCLDKSDYTDSSIDFACWLATHHDASLEGMVVIDTPGIARSVGGGGVGSMKYARTSIATKEKECHELMESILTKFKDRCDAVGVRHNECEIQGEPKESILDEANYFDCVVIGIHTYFNYESGAGDDEKYGTGDDVEGDALTEIMTESLAPVFAVPLGWQPQPDHEIFDALIAFDGSLNAMRSLRQFARLYGKGSVNIKLLNCNKDAEKSQVILAKAKKFLGAHGFGDVATESRTEDPKEVLTAEHNAPFDLIVLGANSRSSIVEFLTFTGSVTKSLIDRGDKPLLIANG